MNKINRLGTYVVRIENIKLKRAAEMVDYLLNGDHKNHFDKSEIISTNLERGKFIVNNNEKIQRNKDKKKGKGGKPLSISDKSLTFNIPKDYEASQEQVIEIQKKLYEHIRELYKKNNVNVNDIDFFTNIHYQENKHINFILPYLDHSGASIPFIKSTNHFLKPISKVFTKIVDNVLGTNIKTYKTELDKLEELEDIENLDFENLTLEEVQELKEQNKDNQLLKRGYDYMYKILNGSIELKTIDRLLNTLKKIEGDTKVTQEEKDLFIKHIRASNLHNGLNEEGKNKIINSMKK